MKFHRGIAGRMLSYRVLLFFVLFFPVGYFYGRMMFEVLASTVRSRRGFMGISDQQRRILDDGGLSITSTVMPTEANLPATDHWIATTIMANAAKTENQVQNTTDSVTQRFIRLPTLKLQDGPIFFLDVTPTSEPFRITVPTACAVESAYRLNLGRKVQFLIAGPRSDLAINELAEYFQNLSFVEFGKLALNDLHDGSLTTDIIKRIEGFKEAGTGYYWSVNMSDLVRLLILWKHGGFYVDADMVALRPFNQVKNAIGCQIAKNSSCIRTNLGVLSVDKHHPLVEGLLKLYDAANLTAWKNVTLAYGNTMLSHFFNKYCTSPIRNLVNATEHGYPYAFPPPACLKTLNLTILSTNAFYPFWVGQCKAYFQPENKDMVLATLKKVKPYLVHYYATYTKDLVAKEEFNGTAFAVLAEKNCPRAYSYWLRNRKTSTSVQ